MENSELKKLLESQLACKLAKKIAERTNRNILSVFGVMNPQIPVAILMVSSECNAKCQHCYLPYTGSRNPDDTLDAVLRLQERGHQVILAGAENLMNPEYLKSYEAAGQKHILTNGLILNEDKSLYGLLKFHGIEELILSLHFGIENELKSVPETVVKEVIKEAKNRGFSVQVTTTITSQNYLQVQEMCEKARQYGADRLHFGRFIPAGRGRNNAHLKLDGTQVAEFFRQLLEVRGCYNPLEIRAKGYFGPRPGSLGELLAEINCYCPAGIFTVTIDPDNNVYGCPFTMGKENIIGRFEDKIIIDRQILPEKRDTCIAHLVHS